MSVVLADLLKAKDAALAHFEECERAAEDAQKYFQEVTSSAKTKAEEALKAYELADVELQAAHKAIHDLLADKGIHAIVDPKDGSVLVYAVTDNPPGWMSTHPVPGSGITFEQAKL